MCKVAAVPLKVGHRDEEGGSAVTSCAPGGGGECGGVLNLPATRLPAVLGERHHLVSEDGGAIRELLRLQEPEQDEGKVARAPVRVASLHDELSVRRGAVQSTRWSPQQRLQGAF